MGTRRKLDVPDFKLTTDVEKFRAAVLQLHKEIRNLWRKKYQQVIRARKYKCSLTFTGLAKSSIFKEDDKKNLPFTTEAKTERVKLTEFSKHGK